MFNKQNTNGVLPAEVPSREFLSSLPTEKLLEIKPIEGKLQLYAKFSNGTSHTFKHAQANQTLLDILERYKRAIIRVKGYCIRFTYSPKKTINNMFIIPTYFNGENWQV